MRLKDMPTQEPYGRFCFVLNAVLKEVRPRFIGQQMLGNVADALKCALVTGLEECRHEGMRFESFPFTVRMNNGNIVIDVPEPQDLYQGGNN